MISTEQTRLKFIQDFLNDESHINKYVNDQTIKQLVKNDENFKRFSQVQINKIISRIIRHTYTNICMKDIAPDEGSLSRLKKNFSKYFDDIYDDNGKVTDYVFKISYLNNLKEKMFEKIYEMEQDIESTQEGLDEETHDKNLENNTYIIPNKMTFQKFREAVDFSSINTIFKYNFFNPDGTCVVPSILSDANTVQVIELEINTIGQRHSHPLKYHFYCPICQTTRIIEEFSLKCVNGKYKCESEIVGESATGRPSTRLCNTLLSADEELSISRNAYYYRVQYQNNEGYLTDNGDAICFNKLSLGKYTAAVYRINMHHKDLKFVIVDVKEQPLNQLVLPEQNPDENYIFTLQKSIDKYIKDTINQNIWGLLPIKACMILQAANNYLDSFNKDFHVQLVGEKSCGKTLILKNYGFVLYGNYFMSALGSGTSIPALRGTMRTVTIVKQIKIPTIGYLGQYRCLHIDEMKDNPTLLEESKALLSESTYSNNKSDSDSGVKERLAQFCISENLNANDKGMYIGGIRKKYREMEKIKIDKNEYIAWSDNWDLYQPLVTYDNIYLRAAIKAKRDEMHAKEVFWIDNYSSPLHDRFPFYFYLVAGKTKNIELLLSAMTSNEVKGFELMKKLKTDSIHEYFESLKPYIVRASDDNHNRKIIEILEEELQLDFDTRRVKTCRDIVRISRIINKRNDITEMDYDLLRYILSNTERCLDINDTNTYDIKYKPRMISKEEKQKIEEQIDTLSKYEDEFGLSKDDPFNI